MFGGEKNPKWWKYIIFHQLHSQVGLFDFRMNIFSDIYFGTKAATNGPWRDGSTKIIR
jgi:hypothetical protein